MTPFFGHHQKVALAFSGGKDSTAVVYLLREHLDAITLYHVDTGDLLPEMRDAVSRVEAIAPHFVRIETHVTDWINHNGLPTDLVPYSSHPLGRMTGEPGATLVSRFDCCLTNLMLPVFQRVMDDGCTLLIRGTRRTDMNRLPVASGETCEGVEFWYPIEGWSDADVVAYLAEKGVELPRIYQHMDHSPECARCSAWWGEGRAAYLKRYYPELWAEYDARLQIIIDAIAPSLAMLKQEVGES